MLKLVFEDNCVVVNDTEEYYFDSIDSLKTVGQLIAFLEGQETFPKDKKVMPFSAKGRKIGSKEAAASTVAFIRIEAPEGRLATMPSLSQTHRCICRACGVASDATSGQAGALCSTSGLAKERASTSAAGSACLAEDASGVG